MRKFWICFIGLLFAIPSLANEADYQLETVVDSIKVPWGMVWLPNGDMLVTERSGTLHRVSGNQVVATIAGVPKVHANGQGGLMDIALHPKFAENRLVYLSFSSPEGGDGSNTAILRAELDGDKLVNQKQLYKAGPNTNRGQHYGSRITFDNDGYLYFSVGERGEQDLNPQDLSRDGGKVYRLHDDGKIPTDNPFVNQKGALAAIYSYGHRNPQGMAFHPTTGKIWVHEHGPRGGDEINIVKPGANYGWPILSYGVHYSGQAFAEGTERAGFESPIWHWVPSIAPSGMDFITSDKYPAWKGHLLVGSLKFSYLVLCKLNGDAVSEAEILFKGIGRVRNVRQGPDGFIYIATENKGIVKITPR